MKRIIYMIISMFLISALVLGLGCTAEQIIERSILMDFLNDIPTVDETFVPKSGTGWIAKSSDGNHWDLYVPYDGNRKRIASCDYQYMKVRGIEMWEGRYYGMNETWNFHEEILEDNLNNLSGCVEWVNKFYYGGWCI